ncbi:putative ATP binding protein [Corchorus olitorius]|uniref:ATP binding protein n=1 Tax=Corchorus olitorius TaxID=93759 RepID=A0A1R3GHR1_9ROSI|nr:putative ATP binding protein [Corchorus olitorius]
MRFNLQIPSQYIKTTPNMEKEKIQDASLPKSSATTDAKKEKRYTRYYWSEADHDDEDFKQVRRPNNFGLNETTEPALDLNKFRKMSLKENLRR